MTKRNTALFYITELKNDGATRKEIVAELVTVLECTQPMLVTMSTAFIRRLHDQQPITHSTGSTAPLH